MENDSPDIRPVEPEELESHDVPKPTYAPFLLALGITMLFWGLTTSPIMSAGGLVVFAWALCSWIGDIARSWRN
jgi:hypothetical protein